MTPTAGSQSRRISEVHWRIWSPTELTLSPGRSSTPTADSPEAAPDDAGASAESLWAYTEQTATSRRAGGQSADAGAASPALWAAHNGAMSTYMRPTATKAAISRAVDRGPSAPRAAWTWVQPRRTTALEWLRVSHTT